MPIMQTVIQGGGGSAPAHYIEKSVDANGKLINSSNSINMNGVTDVSYYCLYYAYSHNTSITTIDMSSLTSLTGENCMTYCFENCSALTGEINFSLLTVISGDYALNRCFANCTNITMVNFPVLTTITGYYGLNNAFRNTNLTGSVYFPSLTTLNAHTCMGECFYRCLNLTNLYFLSLTPTSFGTYTNIFNNMLSGVTGCTVHFPSNIQSTIGSWSSVTGGFGGTNTTVLFDLPATVTLTGADTVTYTRNPKYDTATALAWKVGAYGTTDFTPAYYTSGTTDPQANDTIYSDAACTTTVTTISSIA